MALSADIFSPNEVQYNPTRDWIADQSELSFGSDMRFGLVFVRQKGIVTMAHSSLRDTLKNVSGSIWMHEKAAMILSYLFFVRGWPFFHKFPWQKRKRFSSTVEASPSAIPFLLLEYFFRWIPTPWRDIPKYPLCSCSRTNGWWWIFEAIHKAQYGGNNSSNPWQHCLPRVCFLVSRQDPNRTFLVMPWAYCGPWGQPTQEPVPNEEIANHLENENKQRNVFISKKNDTLLLWITKWHAQFSKKPTNT